MKEATVLKADLDGALTFVAVVQQGSFSAAAKLLGVPKSTASRRVTELERRLQTKLLQRTTRKLNLTDEGRRYFESCQEAFAQLQQAERCLESTQQEPRGVLRVSVPAGLGRDTLVALWHDYRKKFPQVEVHFDLTNRYVDLVAEGVDVALRTGPLSDSTMVARRALLDRFEVVASPSYLSSAPPLRTAQDLSQHECLLFTGRVFTSPWRLTGPNGTENIKVSGRFMSNDLGLVQAATLRGMGIALLPGISVAADLASGALVRVLSDYSCEQSPLSIVYPSSSYLSAKVKGFVEIAHEKLQDLSRRAEEVCSHAAKGKGKQRSR